MGNRVGRNERQGAKTGKTVLKTVFDQVKSKKAGKVKR